MKKSFLHPLKIAAKRAKGFRLSRFFQKDKLRQSRFLIECGDLSFDYSRHLIDEKIKNLLIRYAQKQGLQENIHALFAGEKINFTEKRAAWHTELRNPHSSFEPIKTVLIEMEIFANKIISGDYKGFTGKAITDIVNIGIGGSDLGPRLVLDALRDYHNHLTVHCVSNIDAHELIEVQKKINPETTLFLISSKTFTTIETLTNASSFKTWMIAALGNDSRVIETHFIGITTSPDKAHAFGISRTFSFWDFVGGRFSLWSSIGLSIMLGTSPAIFRELLLGAHQMDNHFKETPFEKNIPVMAGLLSFWYLTFFHTQTQAIIPYDERLRFLPPYLQQLQMESNGKRVDKEGHILKEITAPVIWGSVGTNGQHAFHQLLHQSNHLIPIDLIAVINASHSHPDHQAILLANFLAQSEALVYGNETLDKHKAIPGNRPHSLIVLKMLAPETLGMLIALYEHSTFVQSILFGINAFDQYGVELGKKLASRLLPGQETAENIPSEYQFYRERFFNL
jgi:glucose-6-phosphate isomerase